MGMFDEIKIDGKYGQVKLWDCFLNVYETGAEVPASEADPYYSIAMREEPGFVNVRNRVIEDWTPLPRYFVVVDKWGHALGHEAIAQYLQGAYPPGEVERAMQRFGFTYD